MIKHRVTAANSSYSWSFIWELHCKVQGFSENELNDIMKVELMYCLIDVIVLTRVRINIKVRGDFR